MTQTGPEIDISISTAVALLANRWEQTELLGLQRLVNTMDASMLERIADCTSYLAILTKAASDSKRSEQQTLPWNWEG